MDTEATCWGNLGRKKEEGAHSDWRGAGDSQAKFLKIEAKKLKNLKISYLSFFFFYDILKKENIFIWLHQFLVAACGI